MNSNEFKCNKNAKELYLNECLKNLSFDKRRNQRQSEEIAEKFKNTSSAVGIKEKISKIDQYQGRSKKKSSSVATLNNDSRTVSNEEIQAKLPPLPIGKEIGPYSVKKTLGEGTFGKVRLCQHKFSNELVAIKTIQKADVKTAKQRNSVQREVRLMKLLYHPHIIHVYDINENDDEISIVMEYASGGELFDYIVSRGMLQENESRKFFRQMISAVDYCHQNSVIHRDLKPENMLLDSNKNIKLIDFGFGNTYHSERQLDTYCGSPFYAAPEMIKGQPYCGPEVDVWSLGVILYALLAGRLPFEAPVISDLYQEIGRGEFIIPKHFSPDSAHLIQRMLTVNSKKRASMEEVFNHKWINIGFDTPPKSYVYPREKTVNFPNKDSLAELVDFGISETEIRRVLSQEVGKHPISSLYHMVDEARQRKLAKQAIAAVPHPPERSSSKRSVHTSQCDNSGSCSNSYYSESECKSSSINERFLNKSASSSSSGMEVSKVRAGVYRPNQDSLSDKVQQSTIPPKNSYAPININNDQGIDQMNGTSHGEYNIQRREYHPRSSDPSYQHLQQQLLSQQRKCHHHTENSDISSSKLENGPAQYLKELQLEENICTPSLKNINNKNKFPKSEQVDFKSHETDKDRQLLEKCFTQKIAYCNTTNQCLQKEHSKKANGLFNSFQNFLQPATSFSGNSQKSEIVTTTNNQPQESNTSFEQNQLPHYCNYITNLKQQVTQKKPKFTDIIVDHVCNVKIELDKGFEIVRDELERVLNLFSIDFYFSREISTFMCKEKIGSHNLFAIELGRSCNKSKTKVEFKYCQGNAFNLKKLYYKLADEIKL